MTEPLPLPPPIAQVLSLARQRAQPSRQLLERLERFEKYVHAGFTDPANKSAKLGKALQWLARAMACARGTPELTLPAVPHLDELWNLVEAHMTEAAEAAPSGTLLGLGDASPGLGDASPSPPALSPPPAAPIAPPLPGSVPPMPPTEALPLLPVARAGPPAAPAAPRWAPVPPAIEPAPPPPLLARPVERIVVAPARSLEVPPAETWATDDAVVAEYAARIEGLYRRRARATSELATTWAELAEIDTALSRAMLGLSWLGATAARQATAALDEAESPGARFAATLLGLCPEERAGRDRLMEWLVEHGDSSEALDGVVLALRMTADAKLVSALEFLFAQTQSPHLKAALLPLLADHDRLTSGALVALLDHPADAVADQAAQLLGWMGRDGHHRLAVESRALSNRRAPFLQAAVVLGSAPALALVRAAMDGGANELGCHLETLALAGDPSDAVRLRRLTTLDDPVAELATLAISYLGIDSGPRATGARLLEGRPWTLAGSLSRAVASEEPIWTRRWRTLEAAVRTGVRPATAVYDGLAPAQLQQRAAERVRVAFETERQLAPGRWYYLGRASL